MKVNHQPFKFHSRTDQMEDRWKTSLNHNLDYLYNNESFLYEKVKVCRVLGHTTLNSFPPSDNFVPL
jgi:hypothetical protein